MLRDFCECEIIKVEKGKGGQYMPNKLYGDNRVTVVVGSVESGSERYLSLLYGEIAPALPYVLTVTAADDLDDEKESYYNIIAVGTAQDNPYIASLVKDGIISIPEDPDGYVIRVLDNPKNAGKQLTVLAGATSHSVCYAVSEYIGNYLPESESRDLHKLRFVPHFTRKTSETYRIRTPKIRERGVWTWGHVIYDYKRLIDNMQRLRMNIVAVWNDYPPINAREFVEYAHGAGIKVIWGFSIGWGYKVNIADNEELDRIINEAVAHYEKNYSDLGGDGIYFQAFTETEQDTQNGINIAHAVRIYVNKIYEKFKSRFGNIRIQFGLHATSVKKYLDEIGGIDPDVEVIWEDLGCFPYEYTPENTVDYQQMLSLTERITCLGEGNMGVVLKGLSCLEWFKFENQFGRYAMGAWNERSISDRRYTQNKFWRRVNALWLKNGRLAKETILRLSSGGANTTFALVEDGLLEETIPFAVAAMAELMWDPETDMEDVIYRSAIRPDIEI